ncbi:hypothetical protein EMQ25_17710 [Arsenicitalea aurantiaca]|uniref:Uncharacterized protein n=1 Tax=Arsenicitalea aurantiaca TaxID=1783274 RepID=A0A433X2M6_9HYPH|nr:hypothetical protein [Arsenicitalea aurantiaca]RUT28232.1 hypothetical protein EMQ25_17710 [Arsenicitalea aurantiaca]
MKLPPALRPLLVASIIAIAGPAAAAPEDDYVTFKTAMAIDDACAALKYVERYEVRRAAFEALDGTTQHRLNGDGRLPDDEYEAWLAGLDARAAAQAQQVGCTQAAHLFIAAAKGRANEKIFQGLLYAFHFASLDPNDLDHVAMTPDQVEAAQRYDIYLQQLYGENFQTFAARQREYAASEIPDTGLLGSDSDFAFGFTMLGLTEPNVMNVIFGLQSTGRSTVSAVQFEVLAETHGYFVRPLVLQNDWLTSQLTPASGGPSLPVIDGPIWRSLEGHGTLHYALAIGPEGRLRLMTFGQTAQSALGDPTVRLYVPDAPAAEGMAWTRFDQPDWRDQTTAFEATRLSEPCVGGPCFEFPADALSAFVALSENEAAELYISTTPNSEPPAIDGSYRPRVMNSLAWQLLNGGQ